MAVSETVYLSYDNVIDLLLKNDGSAQDLSAVTSMKVIEAEAEWTIDYASYPAAFNWNTGTTGEVRLTLADALTSESVAQGKYGCYLVVIDPTNTDGIVWGQFELQIEDIGTP